MSRNVLMLLVLEFSYTVYYLGQASPPEKNNTVIKERTMLMRKHLKSLYSFNFYSNAFTQGVLNLFQNLYPFYNNLDLAYSLLLYPFLDNKVCGPSIYKGGL